MPSRTHPTPASMPRCHCGFRCAFTTAVCVLLAVSLLNGCARFQKIDVEKEFSNFIILYEEINIFTEAVINLQQTGKITPRMASFYMQKLFETKLQLESILDIIFFYKRSDFRNYDNYTQVLRYVTNRLEAFTESLQDQRQFILESLDESQDPNLRKFVSNYAEYLQRIINQIEILREKAK